MDVIYNKYYWIHSSFTKLTDSESTTNIKWVSKMVLKYTFHRLQKTGNHHPYYPDWSLKWPRLYDAW